MLSTPMTSPQQPGVECPITLVVERDYLVWGRRPRWQSAVAPRSRPRTGPGQCRANAAFHRQRPVLAVHRAALWSLNGYTRTWWFRPGPRRSGQRRESAPGCCQTVPGAPRWEGGRLLIPGRLRPCRGVVRNSATSVTSPPWLVPAQCPAGMWHQDGLRVRPAAPGQVPLDGANTAVRWVWECGQRSGQVGRRSRRRAVPREAVCGS